MRNIFKLVTVILLASSAVMGCAKPKVSNTLPDFVSFLDKNGIRGRLEMQDPVTKIGDLVINPDKGQVGIATYHDAINKKIQNTFLMITLYDTEANAKEASKDLIAGNKEVLKPEYYQTGCFVIYAQNYYESGEQFRQIFKLFKPYK